MTATNMCSNFRGKWSSPQLRLVGSHNGGDSSRRLGIILATD